MLRNCQAEPWPLATRVCNIELLVTPMVALLVPMPVWLSLNAGWALNQD